MTEWILQKLADHMGVMPPAAGEAAIYRIHFEQPWPQCASGLRGDRQRRLDLLALPPRGKGRHAGQDHPGWRANRLVLMALLMLSEPVLSVARTGLPYLTILIDDSSSQRIADQYDRPEVKKALDALAAGAAVSPAAPKGPTATKTEPKSGGAAGSNANDTTRLDIAKGLDLEGSGRAACEHGKEAQGACFTSSRMPARLLASVDRPDDITGAVDLVRAIEPTGGQTRWATESARC